MTDTDLAESIASTAGELLVLLQRSGLSMPRKSFR